MNAPAPQLLLTPARWSTWVAQRHEWNGYLWLRWPDAEAILLFVGGHPRIHLWDGLGWAEGDHALAAVAQRLERMHPPRWGQVALPARWAAAIRDLALTQPVLPSEVVSPEAWADWARRTNFGGMAVLVGDLSGAWIVQEGAVRPVRFTQGTAVNGESVPPQTEGLLQIYRGRISQELLPPAARPVEEPQRTEGQAAAPEVLDTSAASLSLSPPASPIESARAEARDAPPLISPPAPAESGETAVDQARSDASRRFRGDERFLLAPTVDMAGDAVAALAVIHGQEIQRLLPLLDGGRTLAEVAQASAVPLGQVEALVGALVDKRMVFRYTSRGRARASSA
ncbi:MAG: hypothetical protein ACRDF5_08855 [bacterium]